MKPIEIVQNKLKEAGFYNGKVDNVYGGKTEAALDTVIAMASNPVFQRERIESALDQAASLLAEKLGSK